MGARLMSVSRHRLRVLGVAALLGGVVPGVIVLSAGPAAATAQLFSVTLSGLQEVPANGSTASGVGSVQLNAAETQITVNLNWTGLGTNATDAHIHGPGGPGVIAGVVFPLGPVPAATSGSITQQQFAVTPAQVAELKAGLWYFNVHSEAFPIGEIRAQITTTRVYRVTLTGAQEVPPTGSPGTGTGTVELNGAENLISVTLNWSGLQSAAIDSHIHGPGGPGVIAGVLFPLGAGTGGTAGSVATQTFAITPAQVADLKAGLMYFNVHSGLFPNGEIRAQIVDTITPTCSYTIVNALPNKYIEFTVSDAGGGMSNIQFTTAVNISVTVVPSFTAGSTAPVAFRVDKVDPFQPARVAVVLTDAAGNQSSCI